MLPTIILFLNLSVAAAGSPCGTYRTEWSSCENDQDCTIALNMCGFKTAVNSKFQKEIEGYNKCMGPAISCPTSTSDPNKSLALATCKQKKCELKKTDH